MNLGILKNSTAYFLCKTVAFLSNVCYNNKVNKNEKGVEAATPTPPIKTNTHFA